VAPGADVAVSTRAAVGFAAAVALMGALRFALTVGGARDGVTEWASMTAVTIVGCLYFGARRLPWRELVKASYVLIVPYMLVELAVLGYTWRTGRATIFHTPEHSFGMPVHLHFWGHLVGGLTWEPLTLFLIMLLVRAVAGGWRRLRGRAAAALVACVSLAPSTHAAQAEPRAPARPPNVLLIVADDLGYGDLGSYGHHTIKTPALDRLAREGLRLTSYYAASPLCSPSRAAMLTGRTPFRTGIETWIPEGGSVQLGPREVTLAAVLKKRGYQTFLSGKWHLNGGLDVAGHAQPQDHGFDHWLAFHAFALPNHRNPENFFRDGRPLGRIEGYAAQIVVDEAMGWLEARKGETPFFLYVALAEPHGTIASPEFFTSLYSAFTRGAPEPFTNGAAGTAELAARGPGEYYASVTHMDFQVGRLLERLDRLNLRDDTVVVFTSDNGPVTEDWRHWYEVNLYGSTGGFRGRKADLYEGGLRVPAIVRWPGHTAAGRETDTPVIGYDLMPTLAAIGGAAVPTDRPLDGEDVSAVLRGEAFERRRPLYWEFEDDQGFHYALREGGRKLIADRSMGKRRLYDLARDRFEVEDLAGQEPGVVASLLARLRRVAAEVAADPLRPR
jgi:arylsulfatase A-like enzyme